MADAPRSKRRPKRTGRYQVTAGSTSAVTGTKYGFPDTVSIHLVKVCMPTSKASYQRPIAVDTSAHSFSPTNAFNDCERAPAYAASFNSTCYSGPRLPFIYCPTKTQCVLRHRQTPQKFFLKCCGSPYATESNSPAARTLRAKC